MDHDPACDVDWPPLQRRMQQLLEATQTQALAGADARLPDVDAAQENANTLFRWLTAQSEEQQADLVEALFARLLARSAKSRAASVNACTKLCGFVQHCAQAGAGGSPLAAWAHGESVALRLFEFYLEWNETDQHRSMKLVLDLLAQLLAGTETTTTKETTAVRAYVLRTLVGIVSGESGRPLVKSALGSLHSLVGKRVFGVAAVGRAYAQSVAAADHQPLPPADAPVPLAVYRRLVADVLQAMAVSSAASVAGKVLLVVFGYLRATTGASGPPGFTTAQWLAWLLDGLQGRFGLAEDIKTYFFLPLFKADRASALELLLLLNKNRTGGTDARAMLRIAALEAGKTRGLVADAGLSLDARAAELSIGLDEAGLAAVLARGPAGLRALAVSLLVASPSAQRPLSAATLALLRRFLPSFHAEADAKFRLELLGHERRMAARLQGARRAMRSHAVTAAWYVREAQAQHDAFLAWYVGFLRAELAPTASYQRHFAALRAALALVSVDEDEALSTSLFQDATWVRCLLELLLDPFDDVRGLAMDLLARAPRALLDVVPAGEAASLRARLAATSTRADALAARTARADHADGAARCQALLCRWADGLGPRLARLDGLLARLEAHVAQAQRDLGAAVLRHPVHGDFAAVRAVWGVLAATTTTPTKEQADSLATAQTRMVQCSADVWAVVRPVLCDDAPEGHLPDELGDGGVLDSKDLLSYSFRAVSEASSLLGVLVGGLRAGEKTGGRLAPPRPVFEAVGQLAFAQLAALRHRGALTAVAHTFLACCQLAAVGGGPDNGLVRTWYHATLACIRDQRSTTRRSAGIPSLFAGILASRATSPTFTEAMEAVCAIASAPAETTADDAQRPQVHALNCLREVFRSALLSRRAEAEALLPACLQLAAGCLRSPVWAIRNGGLLLLRSLIDCLFGTGESKAALAAGWDGRTLRVSYKNHATLPGVLLGLVGTDGGPADTDEGTAGGAESVFPALDILRRAGPPETHRAALYRAVVAHLGSPLWHVREMAARTVCAFFVLPAWGGRVEELLPPADGTPVPANRLHGSLLAVRFVLDKLDETGGDLQMLPALVRRLDATAAGCGLVAAVPVLAAAYLETRNTASGLALKHGLVVDAGVLPVFSFAAADAAAALWRVQHALAQAYAARHAGDRAAVAALLQTAAAADPDTAVRLLDAVPALWGAGRSTDTAAWLSGVYLDACAPPGVAADVRATALQHVAEFLDELLGGATDTTTETVLAARVAVLGRLWDQLATATDTAISPPLACALVRVSGPFAAAAARTGAPSPPWLALVADAGRDDQTLDMRLAAAAALRSFGGVHGKTKDTVAFAFCVYDALLDDDDAVRAVAAAAAGGLFGGGVLAPGVAAARLPAWLAATYGSEPAFRAQAAARLLGQAPDPAADVSGVLPWTASAGAALRRARQTDDALFAIEEKNLFVDEAREAQRWAAALRRAGVAGDAVWDQLVAWTAAGLDDVLEAIEDDDHDSDGPLGWTGTPAVFAVCARLLVCAQLLVAGVDGAGADTAGADAVAVRAGLAARLAAVAARGRARHMHGMLVALAGDYEWEEE